MGDLMPSSEDGARNVPAEMATGLVVAAIDLTVKGHGLLAPVLYPLGLPFASAALREWQRNGEVILDAAQEASGLAREALHANIADSRAVSVIAVKVWDAARTTANEAKLEALGRVVGRVAVEPTQDRIDEATLIVDALADLEAPHIRVLEMLEVLWQEDTADLYARGATVPVQLQQRFGMDQTAAQMSLAALNRAGATSTVVYPSSTAYRINAAGKAMLEALGGDVTPWPDGQPT